MMRQSVIAVFMCAGALGVLLLVGDRTQPFDSPIMTTKLISSASQSLDLTAVPQPVDPEAIVVEVTPAADSAPALDLTATPLSQPAVAGTATPVADEIDPVEPVDALSATQPVSDTPIPAVDDVRSALVPLPSIGRRVSTVGGVPVLMYHYVRINPVATDRAGFVLSVTPSDFAQQIRFLASRGYTTVTMAAIREYIRSGKKLPPKPIALTFDDGYDDAYSAVKPVLELYHMTATFYIVTGFVDRPRYVTWEQVMAMDRSGMEIASHTVRHPSLPVMAPMARQVELTASRATLEARLGHSVLDFCYPGGQLDVATEQAVARAGYLSATTTANGFAAPGDDPLRMPRLRISGGLTLAGYAKILGERVTVKDFAAPPPIATPTTTNATLPLYATPSSIVQPGQSPTVTRGVSGR